MNSRIRRAKTCISRNIINIPGWKSRRKIVVIESDDWGSTRMRSKKAYEYFRRIGYPVEKHAFNRFDALECNSDLEALYDVLGSVKDSAGNPAKFTLNTIVGNPDFEKILNSSFEEYHYESFIETLKRYDQHDKVISLYKEGMERGFIQPQFHGREHVNVKKWMSDLRAGRPDLKEAFNFEMFSVHSEMEPIQKNEYLDPFDLNPITEIELQDSIISEGVQLFFDSFGFHSKSFIAPSYIWNHGIEPLLRASKIRFIQGAIFQYEPVGSYNGNYRKKYHITGQRNKFDQLFLVRNVYFEPSYDPGYDWVGECLKSISIAFAWHKPVIICSHRFNFIGYIEEDNRKKGLILLKELLEGIVRRWPDVEFLSSDQLGESIAVNS